MKPEVHEIDILQMEVDQKLPHWLDWTQRYPDKVKAIRQKNRDKWLAEQNKKKRAKAWHQLSSDAQEEAKQFWMTASFNEFYDGSEQPETVIEAMDVYWDSTMDDNEKFLVAVREHSDAVLREWDESQHPRDEHGKFTDSGGDGDGGTEPAGGGKGKHPGKGYTKDAYIDDKGVIQTKSVNDAARALTENRRVNLDQPVKISMLIHKLGKIAEDMIAKGEKAPVYNLCNATINDTSLFCVESKGIQRIKMPQLDDDQTKAFRKHLKKLGYDVQKEEVQAAHLHATQNELNGVKVAGIADHLKDKPNHHAKRLIISRDNYILDGHHHYAAKIGLDARDNVLANDTPMKVARVDIDIITLLEEALKFTGGRGAKGASETTTGKTYATTILADLVHEKMADPRWHEWRAIRARALKLLAQLRSL